MDTEKVKIDLLKGFTLIELTIIIVILGILLGFGVKSCIHGIEVAKFDKTQDILSTLEAFITKEICKRGTFPSSIPDNLLKDGWQREIRVLTFGSIEINPICGLTNTGETVNLNSTTSISNVAVLLISPGENGEMDSQLSSNPIHIREDDIARVTTLDQLKGACCKGKMLRIIAKALPSITEGESYSVTLSVKGGTPPYRWTVSSDNSQLNTILNSSYSFPVVTTDPFFSLQLSETDTADIVESGSQSTVRIDLVVVDRLGNQAERTFIVNLIRRSAR